MDAQTTEGLQIFNKLTLKKTSVPSIKALKSVYKQRQTNTFEGHNQHSQNPAEEQLQRGSTRVAGFSIACFNPIQTQDNKIV